MQPADSESSEGLYVSRPSVGVKPARPGDPRDIIRATPHTMLQTTRETAISPDCTPAQAVAAWPADIPLAALISPGGGLGIERGEGRVPFGRFSYLAPIHERLEPLRWLSTQQGGAIAPSPVLVVPMLAYELGGAFEPSAGIRPGPWGTGEILICNAAYRFDHDTRAWEILGDPDLLPTIECRPSADRSWSLGTLTSDIGRPAYEARVSRAIDYIRAGDIFQVNLAHRLLASFDGSARALFGDLLRSSRPAYGACIDASLGTVLSLSPELFVAFDGESRRCVTRPMKGTASALAGRAALESSAKDAAELRMIVDLMRNDLSRVCEICSVRVDDPRAIETHAGGSVHQGVATVSGTLRPAKSLRDLLAAAFPAGSITGAPKVRAMQIIDELERSPRGPYCGSIGAIDAQGNAVFNVAIRTAAIIGERVGGEHHDADLCYPVGAGIVADSVPELEWAETLAKASVWDQIVQERC